MSLRHFSQLPGIVQDHSSDLELSNFFSSNDLASRHANIFSRFQVNAINLLNEKKKKCHTTIELIRIFVVTRLSFKIEKENSWCLLMFRAIAGEKN